MSKKYLFILLLIHSVFSDECVRYFFEDYDDLFTTNVPSCIGLALWSQNVYETDESPIAAPNEKSIWFITPSNFNTLSCTGSFSFTMMPGALVEVLVYVERGTDLSLNVVLLQITNTNHPTVGTATLDDGEGDGWFVMRLRNNLIGTEPFQGYIAFLGRASEDSVLIVDSFRYVPLSMDPEEECILYEDIPVPTTETATIPTTTPTTIEITTPTTVETTVPTIMPTTIAEETTSTPNDADSCWTTLTITITVLVSLIVLFIVAGVSFYLGGLVARKKIKVENDDNYNVPQILPRVTRVYPDINSNKYNT